MVSSSGDVPEAETVKYTTWKWYRKVKGGPEYPKSEEVAAGGDSEFTFGLLSHHLFLCFDVYALTCFSYCYYFPFSSLLSYFIFFFFWVVVLCAILQIADMQETLKTLEEETRDLKSQIEQVKSDLPITMLYIVNNMLIVIPSHKAF